MYRRPLAIIMILGLFGILVLSPYALTSAWGRAMNVPAMPGGSRLATGDGQVRPLCENGGTIAWARTMINRLFSANENGSLSSYLFFSLVKTLFIILLALIIWWMGVLFINALKRSIKALDETYPDMRERLDSYLKILKKIFNLLILVVTVLVVLNAWGVPVFPFLAHYSGYIYSLLRIPLIVFLAMVLTSITRFVISRMEHVVGGRMKARPGASETEVNKQIKTVGEIVYKTIFVTLWIVAVMMVLNELGFDIKPILAGAGIVGLAVGFGAQNLVRDVISGLFMIIENQVRVGDVAILNGTGGLVEAVNLRTTVLRGLDGAVHIFPNGTVNTISNLTHTFSFYVFDVGVAYKEDTDRVIKVLNQLSDEIMADPVFGPQILEPLEILGLDKFDDSAVIIKARIKTIPIKQWMVGREMNRRIKRRFDEEGIEIPFPHRTVYFGEVSKPFDIRLEGNTEEEKRVKQWVREALAEGKRNKE
ncbi:MAG: mechanosensitive ion channel family protein [bacterium]